MVCNFTKNELFSQADLNSLTDCIHIAEFINQTLTTVVGGHFKIYVIVLGGYLAGKKMVLTKAALEKMSKIDLITLFIENNNKLNVTITKLASKLAKVSETLQRMESQQAVSTISTVNDSMHMCNWFNCQDNAGEMLNLLGVNILRSLGFLIILRKKRMQTCFIYNMS